VDVDVAGISEKVTRITLGGLMICLWLPALTAKRSGQYPPSEPVEAASVTVVKDNAYEEPMDVLSVVLEQPS
tara:strand:+ start:5591 stop:5806 length:216 start_codon:yes stop_codon:yes gene_type:complete